MRKAFFTLASLLLIFLIGGAAAVQTDAPDLSRMDVAYIREGALVANPLYPTPTGVIARYTGADLGAKAQKVTCTVRFLNGGAMALISGPLADLSVEGITQASIHAVFTSESYHFGFYENGALTDVLADAYPENVGPLDLSGKTEYTVGYSISGSTLTLLLPNGKKIQKRDPRVKSLNGPRVVFEHYLTAEDVAVGASVEITSLYAKGGDKKALQDDFDREDGPPLIAPSGHAYFQFRNETLDFN